MRSVTKATRCNNNSENNNKNNDNSSTNENVTGTGDGNNNECLDCAEVEQVEANICYTWAMDTFDVFGHLLDSLNILLGQQIPCEDGQEVVSMWGPLAPVPERNRYGK